LWQLRHVHRIQDLAIVEYILKGVQKQHGVNLRGDAKAWKRLKVAAQQAKEALSNSQTFTLAMDGLWEGVDTFELTLTRPQFEKLVEPWTKQALETVKRVLRDAKMKPEAVQELVCATRPAQRLLGC
jgi:molecular chaperone DnaK (HSP70)